jgi:hypothetical protein
MRFRFKMTLWIRKPIQPLSFCLFASFCIALSGRPAEPGLKISVGKPFTITKGEQHLTWGYWNHPVVQKCANGDLLLGFSTGEDAFIASQTGPNLYRSVDRGQTWKAEPPWGRGVVSSRLTESFLRHVKRTPAQAIGGGDKGSLSSFCNLAGGRCISFFYHTMRGETPDLFLNSKWTSLDGGKTWQGPMDVEFRIPGVHNDSLGRGPALWRASVQLTNSRLVTVAHALFAGETKLRVIALGSSDNGDHWRYLATVAYDPKIRTEGFTEPMVCHTSQRRLICMMRTEGAMMQQSFSDDNGNTWTVPASAGVEGVAPDMHLLSNGVLACSYGRPGVNIMFSTDGTGNHWSNHTKIFSGVTAVSSTADKSTCYTSFAEVSPGRLLLIFDTINFRDAPEAKPANCIRACYIDVGKEEK